MQTNKTSFNEGKRWPLNFSCINAPFFAKKSPVIINIGTYLKLMFILDRSFLASLKQINLQESKILSKAHLMFVQESPLPIKASHRT